MSTLAAALVLITAQQVPAKVSYKPYLNSRFGFSVNVPTFLTANPAPQNGDGLSWQTKDKKVILLAYASNNVLDEELSELHRKEESAAKRSGAKNIYSVLKKDWFVVSYSLKGRISYRKVWLAAGVSQVVDFDYDQKLAKQMDPIISHVVKSFKPGK